MTSPSGGVQSGASPPSSASLFFFFASPIAEKIEMAIQKKSQRCSFKKSSSSFMAWFAGPFRPQTDEVRTSKRPLLPAALEKLGEDKLLRKLFAFGEGRRTHRSFLLLLAAGRSSDRSEEHTSELQSRPHLVCRLLLEKKKNIHE